MKRLSLDNIRTALYDMNVPAVRSIPVANLSTANFWYDLQMDERDVTILMSNLERKHRIKLPPEVLSGVQLKNTVNTFLHAANNHLIDLSEN